MAEKVNDATYILDSKKGLPNKLLQADGSVTDMVGNTIINPDEGWDSKPALPNKWLNPDGTYSTLNEIIASVVDTGIYVLVDELPQEGDPQKIYLVPDEKGGFVEYHWTGEKWDPVGMVEFDISKYSTTQEMMNAIEAAGVLTLNSAKTYAEGQASTAEANAKSYADEKASTAEQNAKDYADTAVGTVESNTKKYADGVGANAVTTANQYTDTAIQTSITNVLNKSY